MRSQAELAELGNEACCKAERAGSSPGPGLVPARNIPISQPDWALPRKLYTDCPLSDELRDNRTPQTPTRHHFRPLGIGATLFRAVQRSGLAWSIPRAKKRAVRMEVRSPTMTIPADIANQIAELGEETARGEWILKTEGELFAPAAWTRPADRPTGERRAAVPTRARTGTARRRAARASSPGTLEELHGSPLAYDNARRIGDWALEIGECQLGEVVEVASQIQ